MNVTASVFVDGTGDGDLAFMAGAAFDKGQAGTGVMQPPSVLFTLGGVVESRFFDYLDRHPEDMTLPKDMPAEAGYNPDFLRADPNHVFVGLNGLMRRLRKEGRRPVPRDIFIYINTMKEGQVLVNSTRVLNIDGLDPRDLTRGEIEGHLQIPRLIDMLRKEVPGFEKCHLAAINPVIGVRESRRFHGMKTVTVEEATGASVPEDTVALASYMIDIHSGVDESTCLYRFGDPYGIPYGSLISRDVGGLLLSGRCISVDAKVMSSSRVMPTCMAVGQAAGVGAAVAAKAGRLPVESDSGEVREILAKTGAILSIQDTVRRFHETIGLHGILWPQTQRHVLDLRRIGPPLQGGGLRRGGRQLLQCPPGKDRPDPRRLGEGPARAAQ